MTGGAPKGISIEVDGERIAIVVKDGRWEGSAAEAERLLSRMHYVLGRARPGTNLASVFVNGQLWGGKTIEREPQQALLDARALLRQLLRRLEAMDEPPTDPTGPT